MLHQNSVFHSVLKQVPWHRFDRLVDEHRADKHVRTLTTKGQLIALIYAQLSGAQSLREIEAALTSHATKLYHLGGEEVAPAPPSAANPANVNDIPAAKAMPVSAGSTYVFDLGYYDYGWWAKLDAAGCRIVTRLKVNTKLSVVAESAVANGSNILSDRIGPLPPRMARNRENPFQEPARAGAG